MQYKLLTPGPLTTSKTVKESMLVDHCTWDDDYKIITQGIRKGLLDLAEVSSDTYTTVLMQGSGSFSVEAVLSSVVGKEDKLLICSNGAYGQRMIAMAERHQLNYSYYEVSENQAIEAEEVEKVLQSDREITHLALVHSETTSGILNELEPLKSLVDQYQLTWIVDAMSSFGGIPIPVEELAIDFLISSANKCIQGVPGFGFVICKISSLLASQGKARTVSLDLFDQYQVMDVDGKWRYTSPTHTVLAFQQALQELAEEGGIPARYERYHDNNQLLRERMETLGFETYVETHQGPFITSFLYPEVDGFEFMDFYLFLKENGYAIYPGKISQVDCFRIGNIGEIYQEDMIKVTDLIGQYMEELTK